MVTLRDSCKFVPVDLHSRWFVCVYYSSFILFKNRETIARIFVDFYAIFQFKIDTQDKLNFFHNIFDTRFLYNFCKNLAKRMLILHESCKANDYLERIL